MVINLFHFTNSSFCNSCLTNPGQSSLSHEDAIPSEDAGYVGEADEKDREKIYINIEANQFCFSLTDSNILSNSSLFQNLLERLKQC